MQTKSFCVMSCAEVLHGIVGRRHRRRDLGQEPAVRSQEPELAVGLSRNLVALLMDRAVVPATEQGEIRQRGGAAGGIVRVRASTSTTRPSRPCFITTRLASHARRWDVPAGTRAPSSRTDWPG